MMINNPATMGQQVPPTNQVSIHGQNQPQAPTSQMMPGGNLNPQMSLQARQNLNEELLARCLVHTQRLRENLQALLNSTKQAANIEADEQTSLSTNNVSTNAALKNNIDRKLYDMSISLDHLYASLEQYDFKILHTQPSLVNHYNELSYEKQGTLLDEWAANVKWSDKLQEIVPSIHPRSHHYRRSNYRNSNANTRSRIDEPPSASIERIISQFEVSQTSQQQPTIKDYSISIQRLSDHLHIIVKPLNEKKIFTNNLNNKLSSTYHALEIIAGHMRAAAVYYQQISLQMDQALPKLLAYMSKYQALNSQKCVSCQKLLLNGLQPTWRDFKTHETFHEECLH